MAQYIRALQESVRDGVFTFVASTPGVKRDGLDLDQGRWDLGNYRANPVVLWAHDYMGQHPPIGRADVAVENGRLMARVTFDDADPFAAAIAAKYERGFLNAVSVGWDTSEVDGRTHYELLDVSAVPVPGDPDALMERNKRGLRQLLEWYDLEEIGERIVPPHNAGTAESEITDNPTREHCAWSDGQRFEYVHHTESGEAVWRGVASSMAVLFTGAAQIPDEDREGVYKHLARHYHQFDKTPPEYREMVELRALRPDQLRGLFVEGEADILPELFPAVVRYSRQAVNELQQAYELLGKVLASQAEAQGAEAPDPEPEEDHALLKQLQQLLDDLQSEGIQDGSESDSTGLAPAPGSVGAETG